MKMRDVYLGCASVVVACVLTACSGVKATQSGRLKFGAPDGEIENKLCSVIQSQHFVGDVASNSSDAPLWITNVQAVDTTSWDSKHSLAAVLPEGESALMAWTDASLEDEEFNSLAQRLQTLETPVEVPAGENVQLGLEGALKDGAVHAEVSQLQITYKTDLNSSRSFTALGNIRYEWKTPDCE